MGQGMGVRTDFFDKTPENLGLLLYTKKFQTKMKLHPQNFQKLCYTPCNFQDPHPRLMEILHDFFWITLENFFYWPIDFLHFIFSLPLEISCPHNSPSPQPKEFPKEFRVPFLPKIRGFSFQKSMFSLLLGYFSFFCLVNIYACCNQQIYFFIWFTFYQKMIYIYHNFFK